MFLAVIFAFQFYFLARVFKKNKVKVILSAIGLYFLGIVMFTFILMLLMMFDVIDLNFMDQEAIYKYMEENNLNLILEIIMFILIGVIYYNYIKNKWMREVIAKQEPIIEELKEAVTKVKHIIPVKTNFYLHFHKVNEKNKHLVSSLANEIWNVCYKDIISQEQIDYMLDMMYNTSKIGENIANGDQWEILKADNVPVGYLHYKIEESKLFLSKIYLKQDPTYTGLGQSMLNHVIEFALENELKSIYLTVNKKNAKAIRFYEKNGFVNKKSETFEIGNDYIMDDFIFEKTL